MTTLEDFEGWEGSDGAYFARLATLSIEEECPICRESMSLEPDSFDEVMCERSHRFTLQEEGGVVGLFQVQKRHAALLDEPVVYSDEESFCPACDSTLQLPYDYYENVFYVCPQCGQELVLYSTDQGCEALLAEDDSPFTT